MNAGVKVAAVCVAGAMLFGGCGKQNAGQGTGQKPGKISDSFRTSLVELIGVCGELNAQTEGGVARREFSQALAKGKSKAEIVFAMWPREFLPEAKQELQHAIHGWELALALWTNDENTTLVSQSSTLGQQIKEYGTLSHITIFYSDAVLAKSGVPRIFEAASKHYDAAKSQVLPAVSQ